MWGINTAGGAQNVLAISLLVAIVLLLIQSLRLHHRNKEYTVATDALLVREELVTLGRLMAGIAHELNTPLGAVFCSMGTRQKAVEIIDEAARGLADRDADHEALLGKVNKALGALHSTDQVLNEGLNRTQQLIRELRLAGRGEEDAPQPVDVNGLVHSTLLLLQHELKSSVEVTLDLGQLQPVPGWQGPLGQVFLNLVMNARQALGEKGTISITTAMDAGMVVVTVADDGPGLPAGCAEKLFKPGFSTKNPDEGTGLGLFIVRKILARHFGTISASNRPTGGAEFVVTLPTTRPACRPLKPDA